jgi:hypothetical protein
MTQAEKMALALKPGRPIQYTCPLLVREVDDRIGEPEGEPFELPPGTYKTRYAMLDAHRIYTSIDDPTCLNRLLMLVGERRDTMPTLEQVRKLLPELPVVPVTLHIDLTLTNARTGKNATIHKGRRNFVVARVGNVRWIFWLSGLRQGRLVGLSEAYFTVQFEDRGAATIPLMPDMAAVA